MGSIISILAIYGYFKNYQTVRCLVKDYAYLNTVFIEPTVVKQCGLYRIDKRNVRTFGFIIKDVLY